MIGVVLSLALAQPLADAQKLPKAQCYSTRYIRVNSLDEIRGAALLLNESSDTAVIRPPVLVKNFVRFDAQWYCKDEKSLKRFLAAWEELRFDPAFSEFKVVNNKAVRVASLHDPALVELLGTEAPVVDFAYYSVRAQSSLKAQGGEATIFGGLQYEFDGIPPKEADLYKSVGIDFGDKNLIEYFDAQPSQRRTGTATSGVSHKPRRTDFLPSEIFGGVVAATRDVEDGNQVGASDALTSLLFLKVKATEIIYTRHNNLHGFALYDGEGARQEVAPSKIVKAPEFLDRNGLQVPHASELQSKWTCRKCHWAKGDSNGLIDVVNDVLEQKRRGITNLDERVIALYQGDTKPGGELFTIFEDSRRNLKGAILRAVAVEGIPVGWGDPKQSIVKTAGEFLVKSYQDYFYQPLDARDALRELGYQPPAELGDALEMFNKVVPIETESLTIGRLRKGFEVDRLNWSLNRADAQRRLR